MKTVSCGVQQSKKSENIHSKIGYFTIQIWGDDLNVARASKIFETYTVGKRSSNKDSKVTSVLHAFQCAQLAKAMRLLHESNQNLNFNCFQVEDAWLL